MTVLKWPPPGMAELRRQLVLQQRDIGGGLAAGDVTKGPVTFYCRIVDAPIMKLLFMGALSTDGGSGGLPMPPFDATPALKRDSVSAAERPLDLLDDRQVDIWRGAHPNFDWSELVVRVDHHADFATSTEVATVHLPADVGRCCLGKLDIDIPSNSRAQTRRRKNRQVIQSNQGCCLKHTDPRNWNWCSSLLPWSGVVRCGIRDGSAVASNGTVPTSFASIV